MARASSVQVTPAIEDVERLAAKLERLERLKARKVGAARIRVRIEIARLKKIYESWLSGRNTPLKRGLRYGFRQLPHMPRTKYEFRLLPREFDNLELKLRKKKIKITVASAEECRSVGKKKAVPSQVDQSTATISKEAFAPNARARALLKGMEIVEEDLRNAGGSYDLEQVRQLMHGVSRQSIEKRVRDGSLLFITGPSNKRRYPVVQFNDDGTVVNGLKAVQENLPTKNGFAVLNFLLHPDHRLGNRKPIDLLKDDKIDLVVEAARRLGEQGA
jgi:hypothetical protein